ncbi:MAG: PDZ domain-containing protein, partial [Rhodospirillaceae bacterium]
MNVSHPLPRNVRSFTGLIILLGTLVLGACANVPGGGQARSIRPVIIDGLDVAFMSAVIEQGFGEIHERAYTEPNLDDLFAAAIQELDRIDPNIWFMVTPEDVFIIAGEDQIAPLGKTPRGDVNAWIEISLRAILAARQASIPFRLADSEVFYSALFDGALSTLDQYSRYSGAREATRNRVYRDGSVGLGMHVVAAPEGALVRNVVDHGPAARAGIMIDDVIVSADGEPLAEKSLPEILFNLH